MQRCDSHYSLDVPGESVDERLFRTEYTAAAQLAENGDPAEASMRLRHALRLWRGNALEGIGSDQLVGEATRLDEIRMHALEQLVNWEFAEGRYHKMIPDLCLWSDTYPHNEHLHARLAEALHHASRTAEALEVLRQLHHRLDRELGIRPGPVVLNLEAQLRRPTPTSAPGSPVDLAALKDIHATLANLTDTMQALIKDVPALSRADSHRLSDKV